MAEEIGLVLWYIMTEEDDCKRKTRIHLKQLRDRSNPFELSTAHFKNCFRLSKETVRFIINELKPFDEEISSIPFELKLLASLHFYGHGSYQKAVGSNSLVGLSQPSVSRSLANISKLIEKHLGPKFVKFPISQPENQKCKERFFQKFGLPNIIGCIDGCQIAIVAPPQNDEERPAHLFMNRKGYYSINAEMVVDADMRYLSVNPKFPGSVHDSGIWVTSQVRANMRNTYVENNSAILLGDSGYPLEPWLFTPFDSNTRDPAEVLFNQFHKTTRNVAERTFGVTKSRFRCLLKHRTLHYYPTVAGVIINAVCTLHNICISQNDTNDSDDTDGPTMKEMKELIAKILSKLQIIFSWKEVE